MEIFWLAALCLLNMGAPKIVGVANVSEKLQRPELFPGSPNVTMGQMATIRCLCRNVSLPVTFTLFLNQSSRGTSTVSDVGEATFNVTIYSHTQLGIYKCKANKSATGTYSNNFTFILQELTTHGSGPSGETRGGWTLLAWLIPLLILVIITAAFVFWRLYTPAAEPETGEENTYENVSASGSERRREEEEEVQYCTVLLTEGSRDVTGGGETEVYADIARDRLQVHQEP